MIVSFFEDGTHAVGIDCTYRPWMPAVDPVIDENTGELLESWTPEILATWNPNCVKVIDIDFDPKKQNISVISGDIYVTEKIEPVETIDERSARIIWSATFEDIQNMRDEEIDFVVSDKELGDMIVRMVFGWNPHAQIVSQEEIISMLLSGKEDKALLKKRVDTQKKINIIKKKFKISPL